jgi:hypothetical protein
MSHSWKMTCLLFVGLPRALICCMFAKVGAGFIVRSPQVIVDTMAVLFVVDIATFIYNAFTTNVVKQQLELARPLEWHPSNLRRFMSFVCVNLAYPMLVVLFSVAMVWFSRQACNDGDDLWSLLSLGETATDLAGVLDFFTEAVYFN